MRPEWPILLSGLLLSACSSPADSSTGQGGASTASGAQTTSGGEGGMAGSGGGQAGAGGAGASGVGGAGGSGATTSTTGSGGATGAGGAGGGPLGEQLVGDWKPTLFANGGMNPMPVDPASAHFTFGANGDFAFGCNAAAAGTWVWDPAAPAPAIGVIHATLSGSNVDWYVVHLDPVTLDFFEGGDEFIFERASCP